VGYCQGMNFIGGILLLTMNEENAFWTLHSVMIQYGMKGFFGTSVLLVRNSLRQFDKCLELMLPDIQEHFNQQGVESTMYATPWFHTIFSHDSQLEFVQRLWDVFFNEGYSIIFRLAMAIIREAKDLLLQLRMPEILEFFKIVPRQLVNPELILQATFKIPKTYLMAKVYTPSDFYGKDTQRYLKAQLEENLGGIYELPSPLPALPSNRTKRHKSEQKRNSPHKTDPKKDKPSSSPNINRNAKIIPELILIESAQPDTGTVTCTCIGTPRRARKRTPAPLVKQKNYPSLKDQYPSIQELMETKPKNL